MPLQLIHHREVGRCPIEEHEPEGLIPAVGRIPVKIRVVEMLGVGQRRNVVKRIGTGWAICRPSDFRESQLGRRVEREHLVPHSVEDHEWVCGVVACIEERIDVDANDVAVLGQCQHLSALGRVQPLGRALHSANGHRSTGLGRQLRSQSRYSLGHSGCGVRASRQDVLIAHKDSRHSIGVVRDCCDRIVDLVSVPGLIGHEHAEKELDAVGRSRRRHWVPIETRVVSSDNREVAAHDAEVIGHGCV